MSTSISMRFPLAPTQERMKMFLGVVVGLVFLSAMTESFRLDTVLPQNETFKATSVAALSNALLIGQRIARGNTTSGVYVFDNSTQALNLILGAGAGCSDAGSQDMNIQPVSITALSDRQFLVTESMWSSRVWLASGTLGHTVANSNLTIQKVVGSLCNFTETMVMVNNSNVSSGDVAIAPPDYVAYRVATQQVFFTQRASIVAITDSIASVYFGTNEKRVRTNTLVFGTNERWLPSNTEVTGFRTEIPTTSPAQLVIEESLGGVTSVVAGSPLLAFWPPPDCNSSVPCRAVDANDTNPVVYLVYVRALAFYRNGSTPNLYFVDITLALLFRLDLSTNMVESVAGQLLQNGVVDGETGSSLLTGCYQLAVWDNVLVLASGSLRTMVIGSPTPKPFLGWNVTFPGNSTLVTPVSLPAGSSINLPNGTAVLADNATYIIVSLDSLNATFVNTTTGGLAVPSGTFSITPVNGSSIVVPGVTVVTLLNGSTITVANLSFILPNGGSFIVSNSTTFSLPNGTTLVSFSAATANLTQLDGGTITIQPGTVYPTTAVPPTTALTTTVPQSTASPPTLSTPVPITVSPPVVVPRIDPQNVSIGIIGGGILTNPSGNQTPLPPSALLVISSSGNTSVVSVVIPSTGTGSSSSIPVSSGTVIIPSSGGQISLPTGTLVLLSNGQTISAPPGGINIDVPIGAGIQVVNGTLSIPPGSTTDLPSLLIPQGVVPIGISAPPQIAASSVIPAGTSVLLANGTTLVIPTTTSGTTSTITLNPAGSSNPAALLTTSTGQLVALQPGSVVTTPTGSSFALPTGSIAVLPDGTQLALPPTVSLLPTSGIAVINGTSLQLTSSTISTSPGTFPLLPNGTVITTIQPGTAPAVGNLGNLSPTTASASSGSGTGLVVLNGGVTFNPTTISPAFGAATQVQLSLSSVQTSAASGAEFLVVRCTTANGDAVLSTDGRNGTLTSSMSMGATVTTQASTVAYSFAVFPPTTSTQLVCTVLGQNYTTTLTLSAAAQNQALASAAVQQSIGTTGGNAFVSVQSGSQSQGTLGLYSNSSNSGSLAVLVSSVLDPSTFNVSDFIKNLSSILNTSPQNILIGFNASSNSLSVIFAGPNATGLLAAATQLVSGNSSTGTSMAQTLSLATGLNVPTPGTTVVTAVSQGIASSATSNDIRLALANLLNADPQSISVVVDPNSKQVIVSFSGPTSQAQALANKATQLDTASVAQLTGITGSSFVAGEKAIPGELKPLQNDTWLISSITPPVSTLPATGGQVQLQGSNLDQLPSRLLVGPCVANISKVSSVESTAALCPSVAWGDVAKGIIMLPDGSAVQVRLTSQTVSGGTATTVTASIRTVSGSPDTASLAYLQWLAKEHPEEFVTLQAIAKLWLASNESSSGKGNNSSTPTSSAGNSSSVSSLNSSSISRDGVICSACLKGSTASASLFEWTATHDVMISPVLGFQVLYGTSLTIPVIGVGSPAINLTIRTLVLNPINRLPIDVYASLLYPLQVGRQTSSNGVFSSFPTFPDVNLTKTIASVSANLADASPIPIRLTQTWGSRAFAENFTLATTIPGFEVRIVPGNATDARRVRVLLRAVRAAVSAVVVQIVVQAPVKVPVSTSNTNCRTQFPGLECSFAELNLPAAQSRRQSQDDTFIPSAQVDLYLEVPDFYRGNVTVLVTAATTSINAVVSGFLVVNPDPSANNTTGGQGSTSGSGPEPTPASGSQGAAGGNPENAPADSPGAFAGNVAPMGIFPATSVLTCTEPLVLTVLIFCILLLLSLIVSFACRGTQTPNISVPMLRSLLMKHAWLNLIPCGCDCVTIHILLPCCHVLGLIAVCSFLNFLLSTTASSVNFWVAVVIPILVVGPIVHTLLTFYFWRWHQDMDSFKAAARLQETVKLRSKLSSYGNRSFDAMVISPDMATLDNIELDLEGQVPDDSFDSPAVVVRQLPRDPNATIQELAKEERKETSLEETMPPPPETPETFSFALEEPMIVVRPYRLKGYAIAVIFAILMAVLGFLTANKFGTVRSCSAFLTSLVYCLICDFFIAQFFSMFLAYFYRWLVSDEQDQLWSERHPIHEERRRH